MKIIRSIIITYYLLTGLTVFGQWVIQNSGTAANLNSIHFIDANTGSAAGLSGVIVRTTNGGANWFSQNVPADHLYGIFLVNAVTGFVCGDGVLYRTTSGGASWQAQTPPGSLYRSLYFIDANTGLACGSGGVIAKTINSGVNWTATASGTALFLNNIKFSDANTGFVTGSDGLILRTTNSGDNWDNLTSGTTELLSGIAIIGNTVYVSGETGVILKSTNNGTSWAALSSGITGRISSLSFLNANTGTGSAHGNWIIRTTNGGINWISQPTGLTSQNFNGVSFINAQTGFVAGSNGNILKTTTGGFPIPAAPVLTAPLNGAVNVSITPMLDWDSVAFGSTYQVQIDEDSLYNSPVFDSSLIIATNVNVPASTLLNNTRYYWRVRSENPGSTGPWSFSFNFRTIVSLPNAPGLLLPVNGANNVSLTPFFDWDSTSPADSYTLQASLDTSFTNNPVFYSGITQSFLNLTNPQLQNNLRYYWRVNATNIAGTGPWSAVFNFTTVLGMPAAPTLLLPLNNATGVSLTPLLDWVEDISATNYQVQISQDSTFSSALWDTTGFAVSQVTVRAGLLTNVQLYFWRVRTTNPVGTGPWSAPYRFTTLLAPPGAPQLVDPPNNAIDISTTPMLNWDSVQYSSTFRVQLSTDSTFATTLINSGGLTFSQYNVPGGILSNNTTYFWRVNASNSAGTGPYSAVWKFRTITSPPVAAPTLLAPPNGATNQPLTLTLDWNDVFGTSGYKVLMSTDSLFNTFILDSTVTASQFSVPAGLLSGSSVYYWRVRGFNTGGFGPWSVTWRFSTIIIGIEPVSTIIPDKFMLYDNYPNPFNPVTTIKFDIPNDAAGKITLLEIFDITGRRAAIPVNEILQAGKYEIKWDAGSFASGIYIYRLKAGKYSAVKKMIVVK
ncbi:MAG: 5'-nucleotidase [Chlorobi bacterium OLB5]|nr:MAG: 5'-nucleotidase [Chlorobi bacterium OLB5]